MRGRSRSIRPPAVPSRRGFVRGDVRVGGTVLLAPSAPPGSEPPTRATGRPSAAETFAAFAAGLDAEAIPPDVREQALAHLLDTIGCAVAAVGGR